MAIVHSWQHVEAFYRHDVYMDLATKPLIKTHHEGKLRKEDFLNLIPHSLNYGGYKARSEKLFMPLTFGAEEVWSLGIENGYLNHSYEPFTVLTYVIREHFTDLFNLVSGEAVKTLEGYNNLCNSFNAVFLKCKGGFGGAGRGEATVDEMIRIGSLFFMIQQSCDNSNGLILDSDGRFCNPWNKKPTDIQSNLRALGQYSDKLDGFAMSGLSFEGFVFRYLKETKKNDLWCFNLPDILEGDTDIQGVIEQPGSIDEDGIVSPAKAIEFTFGQLFSLFDTLASITRREAFAFVQMKDCEDIRQILREHFGMFNTAPGKYNVRGFNLYDRFDGSIVITNYDVDSVDFELVNLN